MAQLKTKETHNQPEARKTWRFRLTTMLYDQGYGDQVILSINAFLDWMMNLPEEWEIQFQTELKTFEEARQMQYVSTWERMAETRGEERGEERGAKNQKAEIALNMLRINISLETIAQVTGLTIEQVQAIQPQVEQS
ncbi:MAG: hypothetical protein HC860_14505 [Alkalinema sp. RU_4_3]|nr:hypothetical protein [Alkalinema sp. RU_4_3]